MLLYDPVGRLVNYQNRIGIVVGLAYGNNHSEMPDLLLRFSGDSETQTPPELVSFLSFDIILSLVGEVERLNAKRDEMLLKARVDAAIEPRWPKATNPEAVEAMKRIMATQYMSMGWELPSWLGDR